VRLAKLRRRSSAASRRAGAAPIPLLLAPVMATWRHVSVIVAGQSTIPFRRKETGRSPPQSATSIEDQDSFF
jgi:hypothetical protein